MEETKIQRIQSVKFPTTIGCGALLVWSLYALIVSELLGRLPIFQTLFLMFGVSFVAMAIRLTFMKRWSVLKQPWPIWLIGVLGVCGSDVAYVSAVKYAPPAHVDFIDYLWPFFVIIFSSFLPKEKLTIQHVIAGGLGFFGVFLMLTGGKLSLAILQEEYLVGYIFALTAALVWSLYNIATRWYQEMPIEIVGMYCGIGALIAFLLHVQYEAWVMPTLFEGMLVFFLGLASGVAYIFWTYATQKGNFKLLGVLAYFTPVISMSFLVVCGKEPMSMVLVVACILVISGVIIGSIDWARLKSSLQLSFANRNTD